MAKSRGKEIQFFVNEKARVVSGLLLEPSGARASAICRQTGGRQLLWAVYAPNAIAKAFYEKLGATYVRDLQFMHMPV